MRRLAVMAILCSCALARTPSGSLGALLAPNNARPAMVVSGATFTVEAQQRGGLQLVSESAQLPLTPEWVELPGGRVRAIVPVPPGAATGAYTLEWSSGDEADRNARAVYVVAPPEQLNSFSQQYAFACVAFDTEMDRVETISERLRRVDATQTAFAIVFVRGAEERLSDVVATLDVCAAPTIVISDETDRVCKRWFGPATFSFQYGPDTYIAPACGRAGIGDDIGAVAGTLSELRRDAKTSRWTIALFGDSNTPASMRNELTLYVDDSVHASIRGFEGDKDGAATIKAWAGWFEPPRHFTVATDRIRIYFVSRKELSVPKPAPRPSDDN